MDIFNHTFKGFGSCPSECKVYVELIDCIHHICFEDLGIGTSVTNASEIIVTEIIQKYGVSPIFCRFYESYSHENRTFDEITYCWKNGVASSPQWMPSNKGVIFGF